MNQNPLFIPLKAEHYEAFERGDKDTERRVNGSRWNLENCWIGRPVILSYGYGKKRRMRGMISNRRLVRGTSCDAATQTALVGCYGKLPDSIIEIEISGLVAV